MKTIYIHKKWGILLLLLAITFSPVFSQARYKHVPRVKVDKSKSIEKPLVVSNKVNTINIPLETNMPIVQEEAVLPETNLSTSLNSSITTTIEKKATPSKFPVVQKKEKVNKVNKDAFTQKLQQKGHLLQVKDVKKTAIIGYLLWFIVVLLLGIALFVLAFVFLGIIAYSLYYVFLVFGIVGLAIALFILIFGLAGIL